MSVGIARRLSPFWWNSRDLLVVAELFRDERERIETPREVEVAGELQHRVSDAGEVAGAEGKAVETVRELVAARFVPEVDRQGLDGPVVDREVSVRISAGREQKERAPAGCLQLPVGELDALSREIRENGERIGR